MGQQLMSAGNVSFFRRGIFFVNFFIFWDFNFFISTLYLEK